jgi:hypothetical protein
VYTFLSNLLLVTLWQGAALTIDRPLPIFNVLRLVNILFVKEPVLPCLSHLEGEIDLTALLSVH